MTALARPAPARPAVALGAGTGLAAAILAVVAVEKDRPPQPDQVASLPYVVAAVVLITALVFGVLLPRVTQADRSPAQVGAAGLALSAVAAVLLMPAFWSALPLVLAVAGAMLGRLARRRAVGADRARTAGGIAIGLAAAVALVDVVALVAG